MKLLVLFGVFAIVAYASSAAVPGINDGPIYELKPITEDAGSINKELEVEASELESIRHRRVTCDVLSVQSKWLSINHSACAVRCLAQRHKGGRCQNGVCICRN